jgi:hypothetical protein
VVPPAAPVRPAAPLRGEVEFRDVTFAYEGGPVVLDRLSSSIPRVSGGSGALMP